MLQELPEPIPPRFPYGYLNDQDAADLYVADFFFTTTCQWCGAVMSKNPLGYYKCSGTLELPSCDDAEV